MRKLTSTELQHVYGGCGGTHGGSHSGHSHSKGKSHSKHKSHSKSKSHSKGKSRSHSNDGGCGCP